MSHVWTVISRILQRGEGRNLGVALKGPSGLCFISKHIRVPLHYFESDSQL